MKIYYLGPPASFTHQAGLKLFDTKNLTSSSSIEDVLNNVKKSKNDLGLVPVENSLEGIVIRALDFILEKRLNVIAELNLPIIQNLLTNETKLKDIKTVYSHPHAIAQTTKWIKKHLPNATIKETLSTSQAAVIASQIPGTAAIASKDAAKLYKLKVATKNINNSRTNVTRFWIVSKKADHNQLAIPHLLPTKTSCYLVIHDKVGALRNLLDTFAQNQVSLTSIQSRPLFNQPWKYGFFVDLLVDANDPLARRMFNSLKRLHPIVNILGSYPQLGTFNHKTIVTYNVKRIEKIFSEKNQVSKEYADKVKTFLQKLNLSPEIKKTFFARFLIIPSVALYKFRHHQKINDPAREKQLTKKISVFPKLISPYKQILRESKKLQKNIITGLKTKKMSSSHITYFSINDLRYYIDYLDTLTLALSNKTKL